MFSQNERPIATTKGVDVQDLLRHVRDQDFNNYLMNQFTAEAQRMLNEPDADHSAVLMKGILLLSDRNPQILYLRSLSQEERLKISNMLLTEPAMLFGGYNQKTHNFTHIFKELLVPIQAKSLMDTMLAELSTLPAKTAQQKKLMDTLSSASVISTNVIRQYFSLHPVNIDGAVQKIQEMHDRNLSPLEKINALLDGLMRGLMREIRKLGSSPSE